MLGFITLPTNLIGQISTPATTIIGDLAPYATLVIGISLGFFVLSWVIGLIRGEKEEKNNDVIEEHSVNFDDYLE
jgi:hypothetical protein